MIANKSETVHSDGNFGMHTVEVAAIVVEDVDASYIPNSLRSAKDAFRSRASPPESFKCPGVIKQTCNQWKHAHRQNVQLLACARPESKQDSSGVEESQSNLDFFASQGTDRDA